MINQVTQSYRPTTLARSGMVTAPHYLASGVGLDILKKGGNAIEATIAAAATLAVVYPHMNSIGGDSFWLLSNQRTKKINALNSSGRAGQKATIDFYQKRNYTSIPARGYLAAVTVPGAVAGWEEAYKHSRKYMGGTLSWEELLASAISYAKYGYPVTPSQEHWTNVNLDARDHEFRYLQRFKGFRDTFLKKDGTAYRTGEIMKQPDLARTLEAIAEEGSQVLYHGKIGEQIVKEVQENDGLLTKEDFERHRSDWVKPISVPYRGYKAYNLPPNTQGFASLSILNILNQFDLQFIKEGSAEYYHLLVEATKLAFADRDEWLTDPEFLDIPLQKLLSGERGQDLAAHIDFSHANNLNKQLEPKGDTVWLGVVDQEGNAVSFIQSIYHDFGSGIIPEGTGITLQNRGSFFSLDPVHVNRLEPNKRTFHTLNPAMLLKDDDPYLVYGTMGGEGQPQTQAALVTRIIDYGYRVQAAIEAPRWLYGRTWGADSNSLKMEARIPEAVLQELKQKGHSIKFEEGFSDTMGHAGAILINPETGVKHGGADPRGDGAALGF
ncbi:gamma-glutamyltransferase [Domibacillus robiginosus]|uniref:gamma-glutamyltransferase n=1 Tax=Domibacillus robiginosus TaxID=1071054 RepID=UPI00067C533A|nr:gamma-glutamyltransferase [Domibacillus robiginosus]